ncbi:MAG: hypothetical protein M9895_00105 [Aquamicrobium sp.]|uniref:hypothetical protein n=1 Tax=Aquamicrobium sp. TaxID=1872579 RepID=UPI00349E80B4|nr:hypothetical protein [Aquamicrobium sp.]
MTARNFDAIASLFDLVEPMLTEFDDYRINGALAAARKQHEASAAFIKHLATFSTPDDEFAERKAEEGDDCTYEDASEMAADFESDRLYDEYLLFVEMIEWARQIHNPAPVCMEDLIEKDAAARAADPVKAALLDCIGALSACMDQIHQMRGMFDDADGTIQDALDAAEDAQAKAREAIG